MPALDERSGLQALYFLLDDAVALAGGCFQTLVVENPNYSLPVRDQTGALEYVQGYGDSGPACTQPLSRRRSWPRDHLSKPR